MEDEFIITSINDDGIAVGSTVGEIAPIEVESGEISLSLQKELMTMDKLMELAKFWAKSTIVPVSYMNRPENCLVALEMASRMGVSPMMVMQNLYVIQGKPSWSGQAISALIKADPRYKNVELNYVGEEGKDSWGAYISAENTRNGKIVKGATVTIATAKREGWYAKSGSKWQTMPELMLAYRAYAWFGRVFCPERMMGMQSADEITDVATSTEHVSTPKNVNPYLEVK